MNFNEFSLACDRTDCDYGVVAKRLADNPSLLMDLHGLIGVATELQEFMEESAAYGPHSVQALCEIGDAYYFLTRSMKAHGLTDKDLIEAEKTSWGQALDAALYLQDIVKAGIFYGRAPDKQEVIKHLSCIASYLAKAVNNTPEAAWNAVIEKLKKRYPAKFTEECANIRSTQVEYDAAARGIGK